MHAATRIANEIIERGQRANPPRSYTPMQLLKLVYLCHGWMLGLYGRALIEDDVQAWKYGPVIPGLYHEIKGYRDGPVTQKITHWWDTSEQAPLDQFESAVIDQTIEAYGRFTGIQLSQITHAPNTPWSLTFRPDQLSTVISDEVIRDHYQRLYRERTGEQSVGANG